MMLASMCFILSNECFDRVSSVDMGMRRKERLLCGWWKGDLMSRRHAIERERLMEVVSEILKSTIIGMYSWSGRESEFTG